MSSLELHTTSPDPHAFRYFEDGVLKDALTYSSTNVMARRMDVPAFVPLHLRRPDGTFAAAPDRHVFTLDERVAATGAARAFPAWALTDVSPRRGPGAEVWAPEIWQLSDERGEYFLLLATLRRKDGRLVTTAFTAPHLMGTWTGVDQRTAEQKEAGVPLREGLLLEDDAVGLIDCTYFRHPRTGRSYLLWKEDGNDVGRPCRLIFQQVEIARERIQFLGRPQVAAANDPDTWQGHVLEGAAFFWDEASDAAWIVVSGNDCYGPKYAMGVIRVYFDARGLASFHMLPDPIMDNAHPWLRARREVGAGHPSIRRTDTGAFEIAFHVWKADAKMGVVTDDRQARSAPFGVVDGVPAIAGHPPSPRNVESVRALAAGASMRGAA